MTNEELAKRMPVATDTFVNRHCLRDKIITYFALIDVGLLALGFALKWF